LDDQVVQKDGLSGAGLADNVHVLAPVLALDAEKPLAVAEIGSRKIDDVLFDLVRHYLNNYNTKSGNLGID
jgi:hypothetical protein